MARDERDGQLPVHADAWRETVAVVFSYVRRRVPLQEVDDLVQDSLLALCSWNAANGAPRTPAIARKIARDVCVDWYRSQSRRSKVAGIADAAVAADGRRDLLRFLAGARARLRDVAPGIMLQVGPCQRGVIGAVLEGCASIGELSRRLQVPRKQVREAVRGIGKKIRKAGVSCVEAEPYR